MTTDMERARKRKARMVILLHTACPPPPNHRRGMRLILVRGKVQERREGGRGRGGEGERKDSEGPGEDKGV